MALNDGATDAASGSRALAMRAMPVVFVLIWSTGFVVARMAMPHAPPLSFLTLRFALSALAFFIWVRLSAEAWPRDRSQWFHLAITGVLMHAGYLGGVWAAVRDGLGAGLVSLIVGLQPVLTALWVFTWGGSDEGGRIGRWQWTGLALGLAGLLLVVWQRLSLGQAGPSNLALALLALLSITLGTLYQKRWVKPCDVRVASAVQLLAALLVTAPLAAFETDPIDWHPDLLIALAWSVFVLTLGGSSLLYLMIQRGAATTVSSLMYLVPPVTALMAWLLFRESLGPMVLVGLALTAVGVALVVRQGSAKFTDIRLE